MRNKKLEPSTPDATTETAETIVVQPKKKPSKKKAGAETPIEEMLAPPPAAKLRSRKKPTVVEAAPEPVAAEILSPTPELVAKAPEPKGRSRSRSAKPKVAEAPVSVQIPVVPPAEEPARDAVEVGEAQEEKRPSRNRSRRQRSRAKKQSVTETVEEPTIEEGEAWEDELPVPIWRSRATTPPTSLPIDEPQQEAVEATEEDAGRRSRRKRRRGGKREEIAGEPEPVIETPVQEAPRTRRVEKPKLDLVPPPPVVVPRAEVRAPRKPPIDVPENAPQVVLREGIPTLVRDHRVYPPILFFGSPADERRANTVLEELRMASEAGVHLHAFLVELEIDKSQVDASVALAAYIVKKAVDIDPQAQVILRTSLVAPRNWEDRYPDARFKDASGMLGEPSVCDDRYWGVAEECLTTFVQKLRLLDLRDHIMGLHLERGEWFLSHDAGYDTSNAARLKFRDWARTRYLNDEVTLRASWFDGNVRFDNIVVPEFRPEGEEGERFVRSSRKQRRYVDYHLFLSDATVNCISELAYAVKRASEGWFLCGVSYGYTFEWSHPSSGHLSLGKLLRCAEIDFIAGPPSYRSREPGGTAPFPCPIDSFALNGKLYLSEEDFKTSISQGHEPDDFNPPLKTPQALDSVHWRGVGAAIAHAGGVAWMDLWGNGWLRTHSIWERASKVLQTLTARMGVPTANPDVAVFIDERALAYLVDENAFTLLVQNAREAVLRAGVNAAFYLLSDLQHRERFPESKLYLFLNAWDIRPELRAAIKTRLQRDNKVLFWLYSAGLFDAGRYSLERAREVTGIALKPQPFFSKSGTSILNRRHPLAEAFPDRSVSGGSKLEPSYFAIPEDATVLGEYSQTGLPSFVVKDFREGDPSQYWSSIFLGEPLVNPALIRAMAQMAGAHVWNFQNDVTHARPPFLTVHCTGTGPRAITLPDKCSAYSLLSRQWAAVDSTHLRFNALDGSTHVFLVGPKEELELILNRDPSDLLHMATLPLRDPNMLLGDISSFDVPVMKLDEWIETGESDEVDDDWFLRAPQVTEEPEQATEDEDRPGRRRRRRRGGRGNGRGSEEVVDARPEPSGTPDDTVEDFGMNVVFRRRE